MNASFLSEVVAVKRTAFHLNWIRLAVITVLSFVGSPLERAFAGNTWDGGGADGNWGTAANWDGDSAPSYGTLTFSGSTKTDNTNNSITSMNRLLWTGSSSWILRSSGGTVLSLFDNGGTQAKIENQSTGTVSIYADTTFAANNGSPTNPFGEINAVSGDLLFSGGTLTVNGASVNGIKLFGGGNTTAFDSTVSASGKWFGMTAEGVAMEIGGTFTSGDIYVMNNGTLDLKAGSTLTSSAIRLGGDFGNTGNQNQALSGTLALSDSDGGYTLSTVINSVSGNTSGSLLVDSQNASGTTTISGGIALDSNLKIQQASGGTLSITTGGVEIKTHNLQLDGSGSIAIGSNISVTSRSGTLSLVDGVTTTLSGSNSGDMKIVLNSGTLSVGAIGNLGAPGTYFGDKLNLNGGTLKATENITAAANFGITISANGGGIEVDSGKTLTLQEFISDGTASGQTLTKSGSGTLYFDKAGINDLNGTTVKVAEGTFNIWNTGLLPAGLGLGDTETSGTFRYNNGENAGSYSGNVAVDAGGGAIEVAQLGFTSGGVISGSGDFSKTGAGSLTLTGNSSYNGDLTVSAGTLQLNRTGGASLGSVDSIAVNSTATLLISQSNQVNNSNAKVTLSGGTITRESGVSEVFGNLNLTEKSFLNFGSGSTGTIAFGTYTPSVSTALSIANFTQGNTLTFKSDLTSSIETTAFEFTGSGGLGGYSWNSGTSTFTITAIPEPSTYVAAAGLLAMFLWPVRRRVMKDVKSILGLRPTGRERIEAYRKA